MFTSCCKPTVHRFVYSDTEIQRNGCPKLLATECAAKGYATVAKVASAWS